MLIALLMTAGFGTLVWLIFFKLKLLKFSVPWAMVTGFFALHVFLIFVIGLRFITPYSSNAKIVQHTIQLIPRLPEPTLVTAVLVKPDVPVQKGQPLFQFDRRPYEYQVNQLQASLGAAKQKVIASNAAVENLQAQLAAGRQDVLMYKADAEAAKQKVAEAQSQLDYTQQQYKRYQNLADQSAGSAEDLQKWSAELKTNEAQLQETDAEAERARLKYQSQVNGVNTTIASAAAQLQAGEADRQQAITAVKNVSAQLELAQYYLENTTMVAPEDGHIVNLQVEPGMVAGILRVGGIASFIVDSDRYVLASFFQEHLKYVKVGQTAEVALDLYPGQVFEGKVDAIWMASGEGQYLPTDVLPTFSPANPNLPQGQFAVKIYLGGKYRQQFPIGAQGTAAIYTSNGAWAALRRIDIRIHTWANWLYPLSG